MDFPIRFRGEEEIGGVSPCHGGRKSPIATSLHFTEFFFLFLFFLVPQTAGMAFAGHERFSRSNE